MDMEMNIVMHTFVNMVIAVALTLLLKKIDSYFVNRYVLLPPRLIHPCSSILTLLTQLCCSAEQRLIVMDCF